MCPLVTNQLHYLSQHSDTVLPSSWFVADAVVFHAGGGKNRAASAKAVVESGVAVMGHVGLLPQSISVLGGFRPQGQSAVSALQVVEDALVSSNLDHQS